LKDSILKNVEYDFKLLQKEYGYMEKDLKQQISHLKIENDRLRDESGRNIEKMNNEH